MSHLLNRMALAAALFTTISLGAAEQLPSTGSATSPVINTTCPMCSKDINADKSPSVPLTIGEGSEAKHYRMAMCSESCCTDFKKDPAAALKPRFGKNAPGPKTDFK